MSKAVAVRLLASVVCFWVTFTDALPPHLLALRYTGLPVGRPNHHRVPSERLSARRSARRTVTALLAAVPMHR